MAVGRHTGYGDSSGRDLCPGELRGMVLFASGGYLYCKQVGYAGSCGIVCMHGRFQWTRVANIESATSYAHRQETASGLQTAKVRTRG